MRGQPLRALWVRDAPPLRLGLGGWLVALALMALPALGVLSGASERDGITVTFLGLALGGAIAAAYAIRQLRRADVRPLVAWLAVVTAIDIAASVALHAVVPGLPPFLAPTAERMGLVLVSTANYLPVCFVFEEVTFRGALDAHLQHPGEARGGASAVFLSALWGLWHLPIAHPGPDPLPALVGAFLFVHIAVGIPLSFAWRRTGNLTAPALAHGLIDALRDVLNVV